MTKCFLPYPSRCIHYSREQTRSRAHTRQIAYCSTPRGRWKQSSYPKLCVSDTHQILVGKCALYNSFLSNGDFHTSCEEPGTHENINSDVVSPNEDACFSVAYPHHWSTYRIAYSTKDQELPKSKAGPVRGGLYLSVFGEREGGFAGCDDLTKTGEILGCLWTRLLHTHQNGENTLHFA